MRQPSREGAGGGTWWRRVRVPWFVGLFVLASLVGTFVAPLHEAAPALQRAARIGMTLTLLLIGANLSRQSLREVGTRAVLHGLALWVLVGLVSLAAVVWLGA